MIQLLQTHTQNKLQRLVVILFLLLSSGSLMAQCPTGISGGPSSSVVCSPTPSYSLSGGDATSTWNYKENGNLISTSTGTNFTLPSISGNGINVEVELITSGCSQQTLSFNVRSANFTYITGIAWYDVEFTENNSTVSWSGPGTNWNDGGNSNVFYQICQSGSGTVTMTTADGCTASQTVSYTGVDPVVSGPSSVACGGTATFTGTQNGGTGTFSVSPSNAGTMSGGTFTADANFSGIATINYSVDYTYSTPKSGTNNVTCATSTTINVTCVSCNLSLSPSSTNISCNGGSNGSASVTPSGANGSVSYVWSNGGNASSISGLSAGYYNVTATDGAGCTATASVTLTEPSSAVSASCSSTNVTSAGGSDGSASVSASGGTPGYGYSWSNGGNSSSISGLTAGTYSVVVTDANGCSAACTSTVTQPTLTCNLSLSPSSTDVSCIGGANGSASVTSSGANGSVSYTWNNGGSGSTISGLSAGTYVCTATDGGLSGCTSSVSITISEPSSAVSASCSYTNVTTVGGSNGTAFVSASGGTPGYSYQWSNGGNTSSISGLSAGNYSVIVYDANGCSTTCNTTVTAPGCSLSLSLISTNILCNGSSTGSASVSPIGASGSVSYVWNNGGNSNSISGLSTGYYEVTATDGAGCTASAGTTISQPSSAVSASCSSTNVTTPGGSNGTASVSATGGTPGYSYQWSNGGNTSSISGLSAGNYSVIVYDANGCSTSCNTTITAPGCTLSLSPSQTNILCNGNNTGSASVTPNGAIGSVSYAWSNGGNTNSITNLTAGSYNVTATDGAGCTASAGVTVSQPTALSISCSSTSVTTNGGTDGTASVSVSGGTVSYLYAWSNGGTGATISNLTAGNYSVQVTDANGCTATCATNVNQPGCNINATITNLVCNNMGTTTASDDRYSFDLTVTNPTSTVGNYTSNNALISGANYGIVKNITNQFLISSGVLTFIVSDGAVPSCNQTVTVTPPSACSTPCNLDHVVTSITKINSTTLGISFTISGSNGNAWTAIQKTDPTGTLPYNTLLTGVGDGTYYTTAPLISYTDNFGYGGQGFVFRTTLDGYFNCMDDEFLMLPKACLGNYVWDDKNKDGIQNNNEVGVAGVTVTLYDNLNIIWGSTLTDAYGYYQFCSLIPGTYHVGITLPINYKFTVKNTPDDLIDSDVDTLTGLTQNYVITAGDSNMTLDAGIYFDEPITASVGNYVWLDTDHDGIQDTNELGISGVTVILYNSSDQPIATMLTNSQGYYLFTNVIPGNYSVKFIAPVGLIFSPNNGSIDATTNSDVNINTGITTIFTVNAGDKITYVDAGLYSQPIINGGLGDKIWYDQNQNGVQDLNETGVANVTVTLYAGNGTTFIAGTKSDAYGNYIFNNLPQGQYVVGFSSLPSGYVLTTTTGTDSTSNSDANVTTGKTPVINLGAGQYNMTYDAGIYNNIPTNNNSIGNYVWYDNNKDGIQDVSEDGASGITVTLYDNATTTIINSTSTDVNGYYLFPDLPNGTYYVGFNNLPVGYVFSNKGAGTTSTDSDPSVATGLTDTVILSGNTHNMTLDAGINQGARFSGLGTLGDLVWYDMNNNGLQDANESGVSGVLVTLYYGDGTTTIRTTTTDALGNYIFTGLGDTSYVVGFSNLPSGFTISPKNADNAGLNGETNSDVNTTTLKTDVVVLGIAEDNMNLDMGIVPPVGTASLGNFVWFDLNNDGLQSVGEPGVQGVSVALYNNLDSIINTTTTNENGEYTFVGLTPATYHVGFSNLPVGYSFTTLNVNAAGINGPTNSDANATTGLTTTVTLANGDNNLNLDAGIVSTTIASVGDYVWYDEDRDGIQDASETGISGVLVTLYNSSNVPVASTITNPDGSYIFTNVTPGVYTMNFTNIPNGLVFTTQETDTASNTGSNVNATTGVTPSFTVTAGTHNPTIDAGLMNPLVTGLGNYVWLDVNLDGLQDASEPPVAGVIVTLFAQDGTTVLATAITSGNGAYSFTNLNAGTYIVGFSNFPAGYYKTRSVGTLNDATNSDLNAFNKTAPIVLALGTYNPNIDAGIMFGFPLSAKELRAINAVVNNNECTINWITVDEINTQSFNIERSINGIDFETVGTTQANGTSNGKLSYDFIDNIEAVKDIAIIYYRIQLIDIDGKQTMSNIINTKPVNTNGDITIYPVPFTDQVLIDYSSISASTIKISISDLSGRTISTNEKEVTIGNNTIEINGLSVLPSGTYFVTIVDDFNGNKYIRKINK